MITGLLRVSRQLPLGHIHAVAHPLQGHVAGHIGRELDADHREALGAAGADLLDAADAVKLLLDFHRHGGFDILRRDPLVRRGNQDVRDGNIREGLAGQCHIAVDAHHDDDKAQDSHGSSVSDGNIGD